MRDVEDDCATLVAWFKDLSLNADKCHLLFLGCNVEQMFASVGNAIIWEENSFKLLGIFIDSNLSLNEHAKTICKKASQKLTLLLRIANILPGEQRKILVNTFFDSQFNYCPLLWMSRSRSLNHKINRLHERSLRIAYNDYTATFEDLLAKARTVTIH